MLLPVIEGKERECDGKRGGVEEVLSDVEGTGQSVLPKPMKRFLMANERDIYWIEQKLFSHGEAKKAGSGSV